MPRNRSLGLFPSSGYKNFTMNDLALSQRMTYSKENELDTIKEYLSLFSELFSTVHQYFKNDLDDQLMIMRKAFVLYFGILYCKSSNIDKTLLFFQLFSQYQCKIQDSYSSEENSSGYVLQLCYNIDTFIKILSFYCHADITQRSLTRAALNFPSFKPP